MTLLFAVTLFVSATLLFLIQPMIGKIILPTLGGTPAVWNTCMVFFQAALLGGYAYTHVLSTRLPVRRQLLVQFVVLCVPFLFLPFALGNWEPPPGANPILPLLWLLTILVGLPFFVVSTSAPLLQRWFASTGHPASKDPYFLYGASNLGSMLALLSYPVLVEPNLPVVEQTVIWTAGYGLLLLLIVLCGVYVWRTQPAGVQLVPEPTPANPPSEPVTLPPAATSRAIKRGKKVKTAPVVTAEVKPTKVPVEGLEAPITPLRRLRWVALAAVPTSLMLGVTTYLTTDIAAIPLFWVVPLALYLLTFILVFSRWPVPWTAAPHRVVSYLFPFVVLSLVFIDLSWLRISTKFSFLHHVLLFFVVALACHGELARDRPSTRYLTEFYLLMSLGGVLGGMFNALVAPLLFRHLIEYNLALAVACLVGPALPLWQNLFRRPVPKDEPATEYLLDVGFAACLGLLTFALLRLSFAQRIWGEETPDLPSFIGNFLALHGMNTHTAAIIGRIVDILFCAGIPVMLCLSFVRRPVRFGLGVFALLTVYYLQANADTHGRHEIYRSRSFFGLLTVQELRNNHGVPVFNVLVHGGIYHGLQFADAEKRNLPISYFHPDGPIGQIFTAFKEQNQVLRSRREQPHAMPLVPIVASLDREFRGRGEQPRPYAVVGLGIGTLAAYSVQGQDVNFYEIDPDVMRLSIPEEGEKTYFYYLQDAAQQGAKVGVILGDGRLALKRRQVEAILADGSRVTKDVPDNYYQIIVLDAFSSDAIPVHLLTDEAVKLYLKKLADGGILIFNTTNRYVDMNPVLGDLAHHNDLIGLQQGYIPHSGVHDKHGYLLENVAYASDWVIMVKRRNNWKELTTAEAAGMLAGGMLANQGLGGVPWTTVGKAPVADWPGLLFQLKVTDDPEFEGRAWRPAPRAKRRIWTDDYSNLLGVLIW